jgi:hypothetical protein
MPWHLSLIAIALLFLILASSIPVASFAVSVSVSSLNAPSSTFFASNHSCGITVSHENVADNAIQLALNKAVKSKSRPITVCLGSGVYPEELNITSRGGIHLVGLGTWNHPSIIEPSSVVVNTFLSYFGNYPQASIILAGSNGTGPTLNDISIRNLVINGAKASPSLDNYPICYSDFQGINFNGASGSVLNNKIENIYLPPDQAQCSNGGEVDGDRNNNPAPIETLTIANNILTDYNGAGVFCYGAGVDCIITNNTMSFYAPYASLTLLVTGIGILGGAFGIASWNTISGNVCTGARCGPNLISQFQGDGIFTYISGAGTIVRDNTLIDNQIGIALFSDTTSVMHNQISDSSFAAVATEDGTGTYKISDNSFFRTPIGTEVVNAGVFLSDSTPFTTNLVSNSFNHVPIKVEIITYLPGEAVVNFQGHMHVVSGNTTVIIK